MAYENNMLITSECQEELDGIKEKLYEIKKANNHNKQNKSPSSSHKWIGLKKYKVNYLPKGKSYTFNNNKSPRVLFFFFPYKIIPS